MRDTYDLAVVGAGPAGSAAALRALQLRADATVLLIDAATFPRDKVCGDGVSVYSLDVLAALGVEDVTAGYPAVHRLHVRSPHGVDVVGTVARPNHVIPRLVLDARLVEAARARGAVLHHRRVRRVEQRRDHVVIDGEIAARVVVAADGANSVVRRAIGISRNGQHSLALAVRGYANAPDLPDREMLIAIEAQDCPAYAWSFPIGDGRANIGFGVFAHRLPDGKAGLWHRLAAALPGQLAEPASLKAHHLPLSTSRPRQPDGRVLLAGDAASLVNPITGEGIHYALLSGALAGAAAFAGAGAGRTYRVALRERLHRHLLHTSVLARCVRGPRFVDAAIAAAARQQQVFDSIVDLGLGDGTAGLRVLADLASTYVRRLVTDPWLPRIA